LSLIGKKGARAVKQIPENPAILKIPENRNEKHRIFRKLMTRVRETRGEAQTNPGQRDPGHTDPRRIYILCTEKPYLKNNNISTN